MVDQEDIIALTRHVRSFSDALNNLRNTFKDSFVDGHYDDADCQSCAHNRLGDVLKILKGVLYKYPPLHSPDILSAAANIITKIKQYNYSDGEEGPTDFYTAIDQLALSFSSSVSDFLMGDKEMTSPTMNQYAESFADMEGDEDFDSKFFENAEYEGESERNEESEDSLEKNINSNESMELSVQSTTSEQRDESIDLTSHSMEANQPVKVNNILERTDELDKTLQSMEGSVDIALQRTKVWSKYAKDILSYLEKRAHIGLEVSGRLQKLAQQTRNSIVEGSYLPFQSTFVTALDNDMQFAQQCQNNSQGQLQSIIDKLSQQQKEHDIERSKIKSRWKAEVKRVNESRENLKLAKKNYNQKQKELEKFSKQLESKDEKSGGFSIGKKKHPEEIMRNAEDSEEHYKKCVVDANFRQGELDRTKQEVLIKLRQLIYQCDLTMKSVTVSYFQLMQNLISPLPIQFSTLVETSSMYIEGQQFCDFVRLQQSTSNQAMSPTYYFEKYRGEGDKFNSLIKHGEITAISNVTSDMFPGSLNPPSSHVRRSSFNDIEYRSVSPGNKKTQNMWGKQKGSATDDTDSISSRSLPGTPPTTPPTPRSFEVKPNFTINESDEETSEVQLPKIPKFPQQKAGGGFFKNLNLSEAAKMHKFRNVRSPSKCKECDSYVYFNGAECEKCGIICHKKCLENLNIKCGNKKLPRKMTTFGVDFHQHLASTKRKDVPYIIEKCIEEIDDRGMEVTGLYRVSGVKSKVEKLCQQFETGRDLVDLSNVPPHFIASVLKLYLRQLPEPLLTFKRYSDFIQVAIESMFLKTLPSDIKELSEEDANKYEEVVKKLHEIILKLPSANYCTAAKLIRHLKRVSTYSHINQMGPDNLAIVIGPTLLRPEGANSLPALMDMTHQTRAVELLIRNSNIFNTDEENESRIRRENRRKNKKKIHNDASESSAETTNISHTRETSDMSVCSEFSEEVLNLVGNSAASFGRGVEKTTSGDMSNVRETTLTDPPASNVQSNQKSKVHEDYDNLNESSHSEAQVSPTSDKSSSLQTPDEAEIQSQLSYFDDILGVDAQTTASQNIVTPIPTTDQSNVDIDDDEWLNQFGKETPEAIIKTEVTKTKLQEGPRSASVRETSSKSPVFPNLKKKNSASSRLETTSYFFSIGGAENATSIKLDTNENVTVSIGTPNEQDELDSFVKRDSKQRLPVRKLKPVNIKSSTIVTSLSGRQMSPESMPFSLKSTPFTLDDQKSGDESKSNSTKDETDNINSEIKDNRGDLSPSSKQAPAILPKPKKPLDKKSWTADLIKSKSQNINEQPQPGSLNDRLIQNRKSDESKSRDVTTNRSGNTTGSSFNNRSVKEIRTAFQSTPQFDGNVTSQKSSPLNVSLNVSVNNNNNNNSEPSEKYV